jgi:hypothetical protein
MAQGDSSPDIATLASPVTGPGAVATAAANTFDNPNYVGELYRISPRETPFLSLIGGMNGGKTITAKDFTWQLQVDPDPSQPTGNSEGADPTYESYGRGEVANTTQIFQKGVEVTYTKLAAYSQLGPVTGATASEVIGGGHPVEGSNPITNELAEQLNIQMAILAKEVEFAFLNGTFARPLTADADGVNGGAGGTKRLTQGIIGVAQSTAAADAETSAIDAVNLHLVDLWDTYNAPMNNMVIMAGASDKVKMTSQYAARGLLLPPRERTVAGLALERIVTDFGEFPIVINRWMPANTVGFFDLSVCRPVHLAIPGKGTLFTEELAQTGAALRYQIYGEMGLEYGPPTWHGVIDTSNWPAIGA